MPQIKILENQLINKIAAGEVVERPANVVKELVENALDAKSQAISVEIKDGGVSFIRVADNGAGIPKGQLKTAFMRHATSKITDLESLENVLTLGFRGEALSSIAGVSQVEAVSKTANSPVGAKIIIHGGEVIEESEEGCTNGTVFTVRNLFYNTPARRKFLKSNSAESAYITEIIHKFALSHPETAFKYTNNSTALLQTNGNGGMKNAIFAVYGNDAVKKMLPVYHKSENSTITGFCGKPEFNRANRQYCNFFLNKRHIKSGVLQSAAEDAYKTRVPIGRFPVFALNIDITPSDVDVNVHPAKLEARFSDEQFIYRLVFDAINSTLASEALIEKPSFLSSITNKNNKSKTKKLLPDEPVGAKTELIELGVDNIENTPENNTTEKACVSKVDVFSAGTAVAEKKPDKNKIEVYRSKNVGQPEPKPKYENTVGANIKEASNKKTSDNKPEQSPKPFFNNYQIVGQIFATHWIIEQENSIFIIDQHAAHERVLYEEITEKLKTSQVLQQRLLTPFAISLSPSEKVAVSNNMEILEKIGFELEMLDESTYALKSVPYIFQSPAKLPYFNEILEILSCKQQDISETGIYTATFDAIAMHACKAAVKANDRLGHSEVKALISRLLKMENPFTCPHGRPVILEVTKYEIDKMFKRIQ